MVVFWILFAIDALIVAFALYNFVDGLGEGTIARDALLWLVFLAGPIGLLTLGWQLRNRGRLVYATVALLLLALPGVPIVWLIFAFEGSTGHH